MRKPLIACVRQVDYREVWLDESFGCVRHRLAYEVNGEGR